MPQSTVGTIGLGLLGGAMAGRLIAGGYEVVGYDVDDDRSAQLQALGGTAANLDDVARCDRILLSLPDSAIVEEVVAQLLPRLQPGTIVIDTTTGDPDAMVAVGEQIAGQDAEYLDATVGGSSAQARDGEVVVMVGGDVDAFEACRPIFDTFARETFHVGPPGSGARMKLVVNLVLGLNRAVLAEGLAMARAMGLDECVALSILKAGPAWSRVMDTKGTKTLDRDFTPQARLSQHLKDVRLILENGGRAGASLPLSELHCKLLSELEAAGLGGLDNSAIFKAFEDRQN